LIIQAVMRKYHALKPFSHMFSAQLLKGKECPPKILFEKFLEFREYQKKMKTIEEKVKPVRNKKGHPADLS